MRGSRLSVTLDATQTAWLDALADLHGCSRQAVLRQALSYLSARESVRIARTRHYAAIAAALDAERFDPIGDFLNGDPPSTPPGYAR